MRKITVTILVILFLTFFSSASDLQDRAAKLYHRARCRE